MSPMELPKESRITVLAGIILLVILFIKICVNYKISMWFIPCAFLVSAFVSDLFTGLAHFGFDYIFPEKMPILGPIASEFRQHHDDPTLDPQDYVVNLTKGAYCSIPFSILGLALLHLDGGGWFFASMVVAGMSFWAFFFHQIHSYAHMGSFIPATELNETLRRIAAMQDSKKQKNELKKLFRKAPIPPAVRVLQNFRLMLNPVEHNFHHVLFESDFSSVNGWSDPLVNIFLGPIARRYKLKEKATSPLEEHATKI
ncbi:fatty acid desaturase CarF family protein [Mesorhizobium yinganensis]|uniref:fatty acid desaturase CarF family protein n=1 Tax=Mesorhizobium yinganensis TaxID=3157707 RepID=UPI0032B74012